ncbi:UNVERIFIED_CONTAM: hypothetical protein GTU68_024581 [Idotea baltica]|nr:hypothetical protein [Idotea baltica]
MQKSVGFRFPGNASIRTGKASPALPRKHQCCRRRLWLTMPLKTDRAMSQHPSAILTPFNPHDPNHDADIERAHPRIQAANSPCFRRPYHPPFPFLISSEGERRKDLVKIIKDMAEQGRVRVRAARKDAMDKLKAAEKSSDISEDQFHDLEKEVQDLTNKQVKGIDEHLAAKEEDLMTV